MQDLLTITSPYLLRILPGLILGGLMLVLLREHPRLRIPIYILLFILIRDAMTPLGLWRFGTQGSFWLRFHDNPYFLILFGLSSASICTALYLLDKHNRDYLHLIRTSPLNSVLIGLGGAAVVAAPLVLVYQSTSINLRGGPVNPALIPALLAITILGNLLEEILFRGYVLEFIAEYKPRWQAALWSGVVFAYFHSFLAITVSDVGYPLLLFALWEGCIAGLIGERHGIIAATLTHGGAVFLLASGLF